MGGSVTPRFLSPLCRINYPGGRSLRKRVVRGNGAIFPIDCLIAPEAVHPRPLAKKKKALFWWLK